MDEINTPFNVVKTTIRCPFHDGEDLPIEIGWVLANGPVLNINAPEVLKHLQREHGHA